jgi:uncharacterized protein with von Willebrand factor type A (vWA) domain
VTEPTGSDGRSEGVDNDVPVDANRPGLFAGVDRALFVASFADRLRTAGVVVPVGSAARATLAIEAFGPLTRSDLYWLLRVSVISHRRDHDVFDELFEAMFDFELNRSTKQRTNLDRSQSTADELWSVRLPDHGGDAVSGDGLPWATRPSVAATPDADDEGDQGDVAELSDRLPSEMEHLADTPFDLLDPDELAEVERLLDASAATWPTRSSRRRRQHPHRGQIDLRSTLRRSLPTGGEPLTWVYRRQSERERGVVLVVDVSGSMESFARAYLHVARAIVVSGRGEVFAFSTELTRITAALRHRSADDAIDAASAEVGDRFGGTRLASSLRTLLRHPVWSASVRGAVVVVVSDGWDSEAPEVMSATMARLSRLAHRVIWVNPRSAAPDFEPLVGAMAAALPHCDHFLSGHTTRSMAEVIDAITAS